MSVTIEILAAGALASIQDAGRPGALRYGVTPSGPMDRGGFAQAAAHLPRAGAAGIEFTTTGGLAFSVSAACCIGFAGGEFGAAVNGQAVSWPGVAELAAGDVVKLVPGASGNYGYVRFERELELPPVMGSVATNSRIGLGGWHGRALVAGDRLPLGPLGAAPAAPVASVVDDGPIRVTWGIHADLFDRATRERLVSRPLQVSSRMDRMGVRLNDPNGIFAGAGNLTLVSEPIVAGDIQILGDGTPIVLMRDHQPTGGYPRIATVISADIDRFAQLRPGTMVQFQPVTVDHAQAILRVGGGL